MKKNIITLIALYSTVSTLVIAQNPNLLYNKGATITIQPNALLTVFGDLVNTDNTATNIGKINNEGEIRVSENWINNSTGGALKPNFGTVILNGATIPALTQDIDGTTETTFNNLVLRGKTVLLKVNTTVAGTTGSLDLGSLPMLLNSKTLTVTNTVPGGPNAAIIFSGGGSIISETDFATGYGIVKWNISTAIAGTQFIVPFSSVGFSPVQVTFQPAINITDPVGSISFSTYPTLATPAINNKPYPNGVPNLNSPCGLEWAKKTTDRFYVVNTAGYTTTPTSQLTFGYVDSEWDATAASTNIITDTKLKVMRYDTKWNVLGGTANTANKEVTKGNIVKYGNFALTNFDSLIAYYKDSAMVTCFAGKNGKIDVGIVSGNKPYLYKFLPTPGTLQQDSTIKTLAAGTYHVIVSDTAGCTATLRNIVITQPTKLGVDSITGTALTCPLSADGLVTFLGHGGTPNANSPLYTFIAMPSAGVAVNTNNANSTLSGLPKGKTTVQITDANGCKADTSVFLVPPLPFKATLSANTAVCETNAGQVWVNIDAAPNHGKGPYTYTWAELPSMSPVVVHPSNIDNDTLTQTPVVTQQYGVSITDACATIVNIGPVSIVVNPLPVPDFTAPIKDGCENLNVLFNSSNTTIAAPATITSWLWNFGDGNLSNAQNPAHLYDAQGNYDVTLTATTSDGCVAAIPYLSFVKINPNPKAAFNYTPPITSIVDPTIVFDNVSSTDVVAAAWNFGENNNVVTTLNKTLNHAYSDTGSYNVMLNVVNQFGCTDSVIHIVRINPNLTFFIPNSFTPNSDNINEVFHPQGSYFKNYIIRIYDRWGEKIFLSGTTNEGWNGKLNDGSDAPIGVYVYKIKLEETTGKDRYYSGTVSLVR